MRISFATALLSAASLASAYSPNCKHCREDTCLKALIGYNQPQRHEKADCESYIKQTVTPKAKTVYSTKRVTVTPTTLLRVTGTTTIPLTTTTTSSVVETDVVSYTETETDFETATEVVTDATVTTTVTAGAVNLGPDSQRGKRALSPVKPTPTYASVCKSTQAYLTACKCIDAVTRTTTLPCKTVTSTVTKLFTASPKTTTTTTTVPLSTIVSTETVLETYTTETVSTPIETDTATITDATLTVPATATATETFTPPPAIQTFAMIANYAPAQQPNANIYAYNRALNGQAYFIDFSSDSTAAVQFSLNPSDGSVSVVSGPAAGDLSFYSKSVGSTTFVLVATESFAASQGGTPIRCVISGTDLNCEWKTDGVYDAEFWLCGGHLNLVQPGFDFSGSCNAGGATFRIGVTAVIS
ncbi:hypothetical protein F5Y18DRAFT_407919 [Xylariaceae sp. FL1019]|nr:hypothetical protein F5Y18DRAFT_407919 [Xylariaceae sp. FL1019]